MQEGGEGRRTLILDGGLATELEARGHVIDTALWSAELLSSRPGALVDAHRAFLDAGAEVVISASYQMSRQGLVELGMGGEQLEELLKRSVDLAAQARDEFWASSEQGSAKPLIAASVGPFAAALADGSEYHGRYTVDRAHLRSFHRSRLEALDESGADWLACETIPNRSEAEVLADLLVGCETPSWISFACRDAEHLNDGSSLAEAAQLFADHSTVRTVGVNCTAPEHVEAAIEVLRQAAPHKLVAVYPNSGECFETTTRSWSGTAEARALAELALRWRAAGADWIGGCCRVTPAHIRAMAVALS